MPLDRFFIGPFDKNSGLQTDVKPWLLPENAFSKINNAYCFRGRVRKRFGSRWLGNNELLSRLRMSIGTTDGSGNLSFTNLPGNILNPGALFSVGSFVFTVTTVPSVIGNAVTLSTAALGIGTVRLNSTGPNVYQFQVSGSDPALASTLVYWYPALPVMGLLSYEQSTLEDESTVAFDTKFSYQYSGGWDRITGAITPGASIWNGSDSQFFWGASYGGTDPSNYNLYVTNFNQLEPNFMRVLSGGSWDNFQPQISSTATGATLNIFMNSARIIVPFKNHLVAFNIWEQKDSGGPTTLVNYPFRARWSAVGDPLAANAWRQDIPGQGSGRDAPVNEAIVTVEFVKDRLIVYFESSTWEFVYTGNQIYPFDWQQINTELGAESTFSIVPFDKIALGIGNNGIHACNGTNVERIDVDIPDIVWGIHNSNTGIERVYGIRDYFVEMVYWAFPDSDDTTNFPYPTKVLVYNYRNNTWAFNDDSITAFGYLQLSDSDSDAVTWDSQVVTWDSDITWDDGPTLALFKNVIGGNQEGYTFIIDADQPTNAPALQITNITISVAGSNIITITSYNNNLRVGDFVYIQSVQGTGNLTLLNNKIYKITTPPLQNSFTIDYTQTPDIIAGTYNGGGNIARVSQIDIDTKQFSFYAKEGRNCSISIIDFQVDATAFGQIQVDYFLSTNQQSGVAAATGTNAIMGTGNLATFPYPTIPFEADADRLVHPYYLQANGEFIQLNLSLNDTQMTTIIQVPNGDGSFSYTGPAFEDFQLHSMTVYAQPTSRMR